jgi:hypothetical protein
LDDPVEIMIVLSRTAWTMDAVVNPRGTTFIAARKDGRGIFRW